jgi:hypothetical protein
MIKNIITIQPNFSNNHVILNTKNFKNVWKKWNLISSTHHTQLLPVIYCSIQMHQKNQNPPLSNFSSWLLHHALSRSSIPESSFKFLHISQIHTTDVTILWQYNPNFGAVSSSFSHSFTSERELSYAEIRYTIFYSLTIHSRILYIRKLRNTKNNTQYTDNTNCLARAFSTILGSRDSGIFIGRNGTVLLAIDCFVIFVYIHGYICISLTIIHWDMEYTMMTYLHANETSV